MHAGPPSRSSASAALPPGAGSSSAAASEGLLWVLAHELRTPITTIYAGSTMIARDEDLLPAMRRELAEDVSAEAARLFRTVEDMLVLARIDRGGLVVSREPVAMDRIIEMAADLEARRWPTVRVTVRHDGVSQPIVADAGALAHAVRNLVADVAWRAHAPTTLEIVVTPGTDRVACRLFDRTGSLTDTDLDRLFDLPIGDPLPGLPSPGIAMYVAAQLVTAMSGRIWARPMHETLTEIGFTLPRYDAIGAFEQDRDRPPHPPAADAGSA